MTAAWSSHLTVGATRLSTSLLPGSSQLQAASQAMLAFHCYNKIPRKTTKGGSLVLAHRFLCAQNMTVVAETVEGGRSFCL